MNRALSCETLTAGLRRVEAEANAIAELGDGPPPLDHDTALALVRRWLAIPWDNKPRGHYRFRPAQTSPNSGYSTTQPSGFFFWLTTYLEEQFFTELQNRQATLASVFRSQFLDVAVADYAYLTNGTGPMFQRAVYGANARSLLDLVGRLLGPQFSAFVSAKGHHEH